LRNQGEQPTAAVHASAPAAASQVDVCAVSVNSAISTTCAERQHLRACDLVVVHADAAVGHVLPNTEAVVAVDAELRRPATELGEDLGCADRP
jgi:hypothetical protein